MTERKILIVVGAGASREVNLPTGQELKDRIAKSLDLKFKNGWYRTQGDELIYEALRLYIHQGDPSSRDINPYINAARRIRDAMPQAISIDNFIDQHQGDKKVELCGKLAIVRSILDAEQRSLLYLDPRKGSARLDFEALNQTWFNSLFRVLTENCRRDVLLERMESIALIVFNYDRCIEQFLLHSLRNYYSIDEYEAAKLVQAIEIYHPYGTVGSLPWQGNDDRAEFGGDPDANQLLKLSSEIKTFTEGTNPRSSEIIAIRQRIHTSNIVIFLGFAFHRLNLELLKPATPSYQDPEKRSYFATAKGISSNDCALIRRDLSSLAGVKAENIHLRNDLACNELFHEYWRSLSLIQ